MQVMCMICVGVCIIIKNVCVWKRLCSEPPQWGLTCWKQTWLHVCRWIVDIFASRRWINTEHGCLHPALHLHFLTEICLCMEECVIMCTHTDTKHTAKSVRLQFTQYHYSVIQRWSYRRWLDGVSAMRALRKKKKNKAWGWSTQWLTCHA